ncbi:MAG: hypothetical protein ABSA05_09370 [Opitutaceae bacterium]|jgi:hypothetical protein
MSVWEYKVITSGKGGFATPVLLESFLNQLGKEEWEIIDFRAQPDNPLAFTGLARRPTQRDWTLEDAAASAARAEADKLRAEFEAKFKGLASSGPAAEEKPEEPAAETADSDDGLRRLRHTESDQDPDAPEEEGEVDEWDKLAKEDELPSFFEAIQPLMRRNQRGSGLSVGVDYAAKKWGIGEDDVLGALRECGFSIPEDEDAKPAYIEYDGDLFWVNVNRRGEYWINTKEKPRRVFKIVQGAKVEGPPAAQSAGEEPVSPPEAAAADGGPGAAGENGEPENGRRSRREAREPASDEAAGSAPLPEGQALLARIRPLMRRNRGAPGWSGSVGFLSRALKCRETDLVAAFGTLGLNLPATPGEPPAQIELEGQDWWLNKDQRGGIWINGRGRKKGGEVQPAPGAPAETPAPAGTDAAAEAPATSPAEGAAPESTPAEAGATESRAQADLSAINPFLAAARPLLKETKTGAFAEEMGKLADGLGRTREELLAALEAAGLRVPDKPRARPVFAGHAGELFWLNRNAKDELFLNAKAPKYASGEGGKHRRGRRATASGESSAPVQPG